jgi:alcohol dehydrogenase, propanol-preferring
MTGWDNLCRAQHNTGYNVNGSFAEYVIGAAPYIGRLPDKSDLAEMAPILCAGVTTYKGIKETEAKPGEWVAISGIGGLGQLAIQYAKAMGLHVAALDVAEEKIALARASGAEVTVNAKSPEAAEQIVKQTGGGALACW